MNPRLFREVLSKASRFGPMAVLLATVCGCELKGPFPLSYEQVIAREKALPGEIAAVQGEKSGIFKEGPIVIGTPNMEGRMRVKGKWGDAPPVQRPATPGYYYEARGYISEGQDVLYVVRKVKVPEK